MKLLLNTFIVLVSVLSITYSVPLSEFFPYGPTADDNEFFRNDDMSTDALPLPGLFPYFNNNHRQIYLSNNGLFSFLGPIRDYVPTAFPLDDNRRLVAGFWSDIDTQGNIPLGNLVYYHIYANLSNGTVFYKAAEYVRQYFPGERLFVPSIAIVGTWYRVGAFPSQKTLQNTFQIVLVTDEIRSFAFLLYHDLQWASPSSIALDNTSPNEFGGQAGFNAGDGITFQMLPYSRTSRVRELVNISNVNVPGLFVFRIDSETIAVGGCGNESNLLFQPRRGSQLGSTAVTIQGRCFANMSDEDIKCRFGESKFVDAVIINDLQAICLSPSASLPGSVNLYLSIDGGNTYEIFPNTFTYTPVEYASSSFDDAQVRFINETDSIIVVGDRLVLEWYLSERTVNSWPNNTIQLEIQMRSVILDELNGGIEEGNHTVLQTSLTPVVGLQSTSFRIPVIRDTNLPTIYFHIVAKDWLTNKIYAGFNSPLLVLYNPIVSTVQYCYAWARVQPLPSTWNENLLPCPLTLTQARVATCCYESDPLCKENNFNRPTNCWFHRGRVNHNESSAVACYLSRSTNQRNAGAQCCYDNKSQLITRGTGGGTDDRYHPVLFPVLHFFSDTLPYLACCLLSTDNEACTTYFNLRPHRRGSNSPNGWGGTWGDPHFTTLDGSTYTFNGYGEYTYLAIANSSTPIDTSFSSVMQSIIFYAQIRTVPFESFQDKATVIHGFAAKSNDPLAEKISITVSRRNTLIIRRGNETLDLETTNDDTLLTNDIFVLFFPEMTLERNRTSGVLTLSWLIGVSIQITPISTSGGLALSIGASVSGVHQNRTFGLLGVYDNNPYNDLRTQRGTILDISDAMNLERIHRNFGQTWAINPNHSLFYYEMGDSATHYASQNYMYTPLFQLPELSPSRVNLTFTICNIDPFKANQSTWTLAQRTCYYDMVVTNDTTLGETSKMLGETVLQISVDQRYPPEFSSDLPLVLTLNDSSSINISFVAVSPYTSNIIYKLTEGPDSAIFDSHTAIFYWERPISKYPETVVRVTAQDTKYNLSSTHEVVIDISKVALDTTTTTATTTSLPSLGNTILISYVLIFMNIVMKFLFY